MKKTHIIPNPENLDIDDDSLMWKLYRRDQQSQHRNWNRKNMSILNSLMFDRYKIVNQGETVLFREDKKPKIDFYPSTGRWRISGQKKVFRGGAHSFVRWYNKQNKC